MDLATAQAVAAFMARAAAQAAAVFMARALKAIKVVIDVRLAVVWSLWLTPMHRATINNARGGHLLDMAGQVPPLSGC